jgi:hypothetical protein
MKKTLSRSSPEVLIRPTEPGDAAELFANLRPSDLTECQAYGRGDIAAGIETSVNRSVLCWSAFIDGDLAAILGCAPINILTGIGSPWMLGTPVLDRHQRVLVRSTPEYIARMLKAFPHLVNFVHANNTTSVRWLRRLGFTLHEAAPFGALGEPFHRFEMRD